MCGLERRSGQLGVPSRGSASGAAQLTNINSELCGTDEGGQSRDSSSGQLILFAVPESVEPSAESGRRRTGSRFGKVRGQGEDVDLLALEHDAYTAGVAVEFIAQGTGYGHWLGH